MRAYTIITGIVFALLVLAHVARVFAEGTRVFTEPAFVISTVLAAAFSVWAWQLVRVSARPH